MIKLKKTMFRLGRHANELHSSYGKDKPDDRGARGTGDWPTDGSSFESKPIIGIGGYYQLNKKLNSRG